jgi:hypothetical protein
MSTRFVLLLFACALPLLLKGQHTFVWKQAALVMDLPFPIDSAEVVEEDGQLNLFAEGLDLEFTLLDKDSAARYFPNLYPDLLSAVARALTLTLVSSPQPYPAASEGLWVTAIDTNIFTDSLLLGATSFPETNTLVVITIDCYRSPLTRAVGVMRSLRFQTSATKRPEDE